MANKLPDLIIGIDIGSSYIRAVGCILETDARFPTIVSSFKKTIEGVNRGVITDQAEVTQAIMVAIESIEGEAGQIATHTLISLGANGLSSNHANGHTQVSRGDAQVTDLDIENAIKDANRGVPDIRNKSVVHTIPIKYKLDGNDILGEAIGVRGNRLEVKTFFVTYPLKAMDTFKKVLNDAGVRVTDIVAGPIAESIALLTKKQKVAGALLLNIGSGVTSILVYENNVPILISTIPVGGDDITKDIALGLKVTLEEAEEIKCGRMTINHSIRKVEEIIEARLEDLCAKINKELDKVHRRELLPAGVIICGGSAQVKRLEYVLRNELKLPIKITSNELSRLTNDKIRDTSWARVYGLTFLAPNDKDIDVFKDVISSFLAKVKRLFSQFLP